MKPGIRIWTQTHYKILNNLSNFELNKMIILQRLKRINELYKNNYYSKGRIGPIFLLNLP